MVFKESLFSPPFPRAYFPDDGLLNHVLDEHFLAFGFASKGEDPKYVHTQICISQPTFKNGR